MKNTVKRLLACVMAVLMVLSVSTAVFALEPLKMDRALEARSTASYDLSAIRNGKTFAVAENKAAAEIAADQLVYIMVELEDAPAMEVYNQYKSAESYSASLLKKQEIVKSDLQKKLDITIDEIYNYTLLFNGFSFLGEYRLVEEIDKLEGVHAFVAMEWGIPEIDLFNSTNMVNAIAAWDLGYTGEGMIVAIIDTGLMVTHPAFSTMPDEETVRFTRDQIAEIIDSGELQGTGATNMTINRVYYNAKVPFRWNYVKNTHNVNHVSSDHGSHVGGIVAGNNDVITGVAPDAQLAGMQVFQDNGGANWAHILGALEDCVVLGVDAANMSLGSPAGFTNYYDPSYSEVYENLVNAGVNLAVSAGNEYSSTLQNAWDGYAYVGNPDYGLVGSPSTWYESLSVASVNNTMSEGLYIQYEDTMMGYTENEENQAILIDVLGGETVPFVVIPGYGDVADFEGIDVEGKIAVISRGEINFVDKGLNAQAAGAVACIIYNNQPGNVRMVSDEGILIPFIFISQENGAILAEAGEGELFIGENTALIPTADGGVPSDFSSWGTTSDLWIKPEIMAPGGNIYSATSPNISSGYYEAWSGTSMAAPHVAGGMAIVTAYVNDMFPDATTAEKQHLVDAILMSTAKPVADQGGDTASVRKQGAGMMDLAAATTTTAYLTVEDIDRPKLQLGDDPARTGVYEMNFTVNNFGDTELTFDIQPIVEIDDLLGLALDNNGELVLGFTQTDWDITEYTEIDMPDIIRVPAGESKDVTVTVTLTDDIVEYIEYYYISGAYVEGYVRLAAANGLLGDVNGDGEVTANDALAVMRYAMGIGELENAAMADVNCDGFVNMQDALLIMRYAMGLIDGTLFYEVSAQDLSIPYLAFYGDWNYDVPMFDCGYYYDDFSLGSNPNDNFIGSVSGSKAYGLGINPYVDTEDMSYYNTDRNAVSPNGDGFLDSADTIYLGLMRNASYMAYELQDAEGNLIGVLKEQEEVRKGFYYINGEYWIQCGVNDMLMPNWNAEPFIDQDLVIHAYAELANNGAVTTEAFEDAAKNANGVWDIPVYVDGETPVVTLNADGTFTVSDNHYVAYIGAWAGSIINGELSLEGEIDGTGLFETERGKSTTVTLNTEGADFICVGDYAGNEALYEITENGIELVEEIEGWSHAGVNIPDADVYAYGKNLNSLTWVRFSTTDLENLYYAGGVDSDTADYIAATYTGTYVYGITETGVLYYYDASDISAWGSRKQVGTISGCDVITEMAYDPTTDTLYGVELAGAIYAIDVNSKTATLVCEPQYGAVAMDFDDDGNCYIIDAFGYLSLLDLATGTAVDIANIGIEPVTSSGSFMPQSGSYCDGYFFWMSSPGDISSYEQMHLICIKVNTGDFQDMGAVFGGLYPLGIFTYQYPIPETVVDPVDFYENFEGAFNWTVLDADGDGNNWGVDYWTSGLYFDGSKAAVSYSWNEVVLHPDNWMFSPEFHVGEGDRKVLSFWTASANQGEGADIDEHYQVLVAPAGTEDGVDGWTVVYETTMDTASLTEHVIDMTAWAGQDIRIAFRHFDCFDEYTLIVDGVGVGDYIGEGKAPQAIDGVFETVAFSSGVAMGTAVKASAKVPFTAFLAD